MTRTELCRIEPGALARRFAQRKSGEADLGCYRVLGFARDTEAPREVIVLIGVDAGPDTGRLSLCTPQAFARRFRPEPDPVPEAQAAEPVADNAFGYVTQGSGREGRNGNQVSNRMYSSPYNGAAA